MQRTASASDALHARIRDELQVQYEQDIASATMGKSSIVNVKKYHLLGTKPKKKYTNLAHIDFFFHHITMNSDDGTMFINEEPHREARNIDLWIYLFRHGFEFQQKAPSRAFFTYNWLYIDWYFLSFFFCVAFLLFGNFFFCFFRLRKQGNEHMLNFFAENTFRARFAILQSIVRTMFELHCTYQSVLEHIPKLHQRIGTLFIVLENNIVGLVLQDGKTGVKVAGDVLEKYAVDNFKWEECGSIPNDDINESRRSSTGTKQTRCGLLHALFLWSSSLHTLWQQQITCEKTSEVVATKAQQMVDVFQQRPSSFARLKKRQKKTKICNNHSLVDDITNAEWSFLQKDLSLFLPTFICTK